MKLRFKSGTWKRETFRRFSAMQGVTGFRSDQQTRSLCYEISEAFDRDPAYHTHIRQDHAPKNVRRGTVRMEQGCPEVVDIDIIPRERGRIHVAVRWVTAGSIREMQTPRSHEAGREMAKDIYRKVLSIVKGSSGWRRSVILSPDGFEP